MLLKLLKHDIRMNGNKFLIFYVCTYLLAITIRVGGDALMEMWGIGVIFSLLYILIVYLLGIVTIIICIQSYSNSLFKREGYLTLTLPVSTDTLIISKILIFLLWGFLSFVVISSSLFIVIPDTAEFFKDVVNVLDYMHFTTALLYIVPLLILNVLQVVLLIYFVLTFVNTCYVKKLRGLIAVLLFFVINYALNIIKGIIIPEISIDMIDEFSSIRDIRIVGNTLTEFYSGNLILLIVVPLLLCIVFYLGIRYLLRHKIELD